MQEKASAVAMYGGSLTAVVGGLSLSDIGVIVGIVLGVAGFVYNIFHKERMLKELKNKEHITISED